MDPRESTRRDEFTAFFPEAERRVRTALIATWGPDAGTEGASEALTWAWQHWDEVRTMRNPHGYLYKVGRTRARAAARRPLFPAPSPSTPADIEPGLPAALSALSPRQRSVVVLVIGEGWAQQEVPTCSASRTRP